MFKRVLSTIVLGLGLMMNQACFADGFQEGVHYQTLTKPVVTSDPSRVEVLELFWYGCPHCDTLDPALKAWALKLPSDVLFTRMPVVFGRSWEMHARMFWVAKNLGLLETIHEPLFNAIHREGQRLQRVDDVVAFSSDMGRILVVKRVCWICTEMRAFVMHGPVLMGSREFPHSLSMGSL